MSSLNSKTPQNKSVKSAPGRKSKIVRIALSCAILVFIVYNLINFSTGGKSSVIAELETMEKTYKLEGIIVRDEKLITLNGKSGGILDVFVDENEMVRKGKHVATYYDSNIDDATRNELAKINEKIANLNNITDEALVSDMSQREIDEEIERKIDELAYSCPERNIAIVASLKADINDLIETKNNDESEDITVSEKIDRLTARKKEIEKKYSGQKHEITAPKHGFFSTRMDGFENDFSPEVALNMTAAAYRSAKDKTITAEDIKNLGAVCKIVDNSIWYISVETDDATAKSFAVGENITIRFDGETTEARGRVEYISIGESGKFMITISSSSYCSYAMENRFAKITVVKEISTGLKVPLKAIKIKDGKSGVYVKTENTLRYKEIEILSKDENYAIVKFDNTKSNGLLLYDEVVINN